MSTKPQFRVAVITVSDRCSKGITEDKSGPAIVEYLSQALGAAVERPAPAFVLRMVPDDIGAIQAAITSATDGEGCALVITTGGTGFAVRDTTPEAVKPLLTKEAPQLVHAMTAFGLTQTPYAWLSRAVAGVRHRSVVITVPGSPKAALECLSAVVPHGLPHAIELAQGDAGSAHPTGTTAAVAADAAPAAAPVASKDVASRDRSSPFAMVPMKDALQIIAAGTPEPTASRVSLRVAEGQVLAADVKAVCPQPPFRASIKDGYAVIAADGPGEYDLAGSLCAGAEVAPGFVLQPGQVVRVNTGGPIPEGAVAVVQVEDTELVATKEAAGGKKEEARIRIKSTVKPGHDIRPIGCDMQPGGIAVEAGAVLRAPEVGLAMSVGATEVSVYRRPRVAVLSTGDELAEPPTAAAATPPEGKIFDSNRAMLIAAARPLASSVVDMGIAPDNMEDTRAKLRAAFAAADVIISTGGVSMGEVDCVKACLIEMGATVHFGRVNMKPGKPTTFATLNGKVFFALPGNPVSAMVCFHVFTTPALRKMGGVTPLELPQVAARVTHDVRLDRERPEYHRCRLVWDAAAGGFTATSTGIQASHRLLSLAGANGLMVLPTGTADAASVPANTTIQVMVIGDIITA